MIIIYLCNAYDVYLRRNQLERNLPDADVKKLTDSDCANFRVDPQEHMDLKLHVYVAPVRKGCSRPYKINDIAGGMEPIFAADYVFAAEYAPGTLDLGFKVLKSRHQTPDDTFFKGYDLPAYIAAGRKSYKLVIKEGPTGAYHSLVQE